VQGGSGAHEKENSSYYKADEYMDFESYTQKKKGALNVPSVYAMQAFVSPKNDERPVSVPVLVPAVVFFVGAPGAGKTTLALMAAKDAGLICRRISVVELAGAGTDEGSKRRQADMLQKAIMEANGTKDRPDFFIVDDYLLSKVRQPIILPPSLCSPLPSHRSSSVISSHVLASLCRRIYQPSTTWRSWASALRTLSTSSSTRPILFRTSGSEARLTTRRSSNGSPLTITPPGLCVNSFWWSKR
jgi:hypothetical protein